MAVKQKRNMDLAEGEVLVNDTLLTAVNNWIFAKALSSLVKRRFGDCQDPGRRGAAAIMGPPMNRAR